MKDLDKKMEELNKSLKAIGLLPMQVVSPLDCVGAEVNARYFLPEVLQQLANNVKDSGHLESVPLVYIDDSLPEGKYRIISGHHRIEAAKEAGLDKILVMVADPEDHEHVVSKQLAHNSLVGRDDETILQELLESIKDISKRMASGLSDKVQKINYSTINFRVGNFKVFSVVFLPEDIEVFDQTVEELVNEIQVKSDAEVRITDIKYHDDFVKTLMRIKKIENIKSNGVALMKMVELARQSLLRQQMESKES